MDINLELYCTGKYDNANMMIKILVIFFTFFKRDSGLNVRKDKRYGGKNASL